MSKYESDGNSNPAGGSCRQCQPDSGKVRRCSLVRVRPDCKWREWLKPTLGRPEAPDSFLRSASRRLQEYGPAGFTYPFVFANQNYHNDRLAGTCTKRRRTRTSTGSNCHNTVAARSHDNRMSRTPVRNLYLSRATTGSCFALPSAT